MTRNVSSIYLTEPGRIKNFLAGPASEKDCGILLGTRK